MRVDAIYCVSRTSVTAYGDPGPGWIFAQPAVHRGAVPVMVNPLAFPILKPGYHAFAVVGNVPYTGGTELKRDLSSWNAMDVASIGNMNFADYWSWILTPFGSVLFFLITFINQEAHKIFYLHLVLTRKPNNRPPTREVYLCFLLTVNAL